MTRQRMSSRIWRAFILPALILPPFTSTARAQDHPKIEIVPGIGHSDSIGPVAYSRDGRLVVSGSLDRKIKVWDVATGRLVRTIPARTGVLSVAFSPDGRRILSGEESKQDALKLWDARTGQLLRSLNGHSG